MYSIFHAHQIIHDIRNLSLLYFSSWHGDYSILALFILKIITARYFKKLKKEGIYKHSLNYYGFYYSFH